jgi:hypothetical protein
MACWPRVLMIAVLLKLPFFLSTEARSHESFEPRVSAMTMRASKPPGSCSRLSDRLKRRAECKQQATERGLYGRMARRFTRLCLSGLPVPKPIRRPP